MGWRELVEERHGERPAVPADEGVPPAPLTAPPPERAEKRGPASEPEARPSPPPAARPNGVDEEIHARVDSLESELESSISVLFEQIGRIDDKVAAAEARVATEVDSLRAVVDALQSTFQGALDRLEQAAPPEPAALPQPPSPAPAAATGKQDLNSASFEDLRTLGLSVTQAARIVAFRDTHGGFNDHDQLREIRGLSSDDLARLLDRTSL